MNKHKQLGFTLIEIVVVMAVLTSLVVGYTYLSSRRGKEKAYLSRSVSEMIIIGNALKLQVQESNVYPDDVDRALPAGIEKHIATPNASWPSAPWPNSVYDYDNWGDGSVIQISARFCPIGQSTVCNANAKKYLKEMVKACSPDTQSCLSQTDLNNWDAESAVYYCIIEDVSSASTTCRSHESRPVNHPGWRIDVSQFD